MARNTNREKPTKRVPRDSRPRGRRRVCVFCKQRIAWVDYKDVNLLRRFMSDRGKIRARRVTGNCAQHQRDVQVAIKTARELALLPYTQRTTTDRLPGRPPRQAPEQSYGEGAPLADEPSYEDTYAEEEIDVDAGVGDDDDAEDAAEPVEAEA
jgi:small subunit ribosomal protein S18